MPHLRLPFLPYLERKAPSNATGTAFCASPTPKPPPSPSPRALKQTHRLIVHYQTPPKKSLNPCVCSKASQAHRANLLTFYTKAPSCRKGYSFGHDGFPGAEKYSTLYDEPSHSRISRGRLSVPPRVHRTDVGIATANVISIDIHTVLLAARVEVRGRRPPERQESLYLQSSRL